MKRVEDFYLNCPALVSMFVHSEQNLGYHAFADRLLVIK